MSALAEYGQEFQVRPMFDPASQVLFLGDNPSWTKISHALSEAAGLPLKVRRQPSLAELIRTVAAGQFQAVAVDLHAWSFPPLRAVGKIRQEFPAVPIIALCYASVKDLEKKALRAGASRCLEMATFTAGGLQEAVLSSLAESKSQVYPQVDSPAQITAVTEVSAGFPAIKNQAISHALNNLLCVISAHADILADHLKDSECGIRNVEEIKKAAKSAAELMRKLK